MGEIFIQRKVGCTAVLVDNMNGKAVNFRGPSNLTNTIYYAAGKFGGELNMAVWQSISLQLPN